jgi:hypothetical protein
MKIIAVFDAVTCYEIEVPDGTSPDECEILAGEWLDENFERVAEAINESMIDVKEVYV